MMLHRGNLLLFFPANSRMVSVFASVFITSVMISDPLASTATSAMANFKSL